ncbi:MAG: hypothetical protein ACKOSQ_08715 [Planctomycetaceae bacterium]
MSDGEKRIVCRGSWWPECVVPGAVFGVGWLLSWNPYVTIGAALAGIVVTQIVKPRGPGRWTE